MEPWLEHFAETCFRRSADTAHDLKTPLNIAVLNLELMRMRAKKAAEEDDEKFAAHARAVEQELRRLARIFDAFFVYSVPPRDGTEPGHLLVAPVLKELASSAGVQIADGTAETVYAHEGRFRDLLRLFLEGASRLIEGGLPSVETKAVGGRLTIKLSGPEVTPDLEVEKIFKFYHLDVTGNPDLALATARLIAETMGGTMSGWRDDGRILVELDLPTSER